MLYEVITVLQAVATLIWMLPTVALIRELLAQYGFYA